MFSEAALKRHRLTSLVLVVVFALFGLQMVPSFLTGGEPHGAVLKQAKEELLAFHVVDVKPLARKLQEPLMPLVLAPGGVGSLAMPEFCAGSFAPWAEGSVERLEAGQGWGRAPPAVAALHQV